MATTIDELQVIISANNAQFSQKLNETNNQVANLSKNISRSFRGVSAGAVMAGSVLSSVLSTAFRAVSASVDKAVERLDTLNNFPRVMSNLGISASESQKTIQYLSDKLVGLPTTINEAALSVQRLTSANGNIKASTAMFLAMNNAILAGGAPMDLQRSALEQLSQAYTKGVPDMMEWRTMMMAMPAQLKQVAMAMNLPSADQLGEALRNGQVSMNDFMATMVKLNNQGIAGFQSFADQAKNSTGGVATAIANLKTAIVRAVASIMDAIGQANISGFISAIANSINAVVPYIVGFTKVVMEAVGWVVGLFGGTIKTTKSIQTSAQSAGASVGKIANNAGNATKALGGAQKAAKKLKGTLASFDEMNVLEAPQAAAGGGKSGGGGAGGGAGGGGAGGASVAMPTVDYGNKLNDVAGKADAIAKKIKDAFSNLSKVLSKSLAIDSLVKAFSKGFQAIESNSQKVMSNIARIADATWQAICKTIDEYGGTLDSQFASMFNGIGDLWKSSIDLLFAPLDGFTSGFADSWGKNVQSATDGMAKIIGAVAEGVGQMGESLSGVVDSIVEPVRQGFNNIGTLAGDYYSSWLDTAGKYVPEIVKTFSDMFSDICDNIFKPSVGLLGDIWVGFTGSLLDVWNKSGKGILDGLFQFFKNIMDTFHKLYTDILEPIVKPFIEELKGAWDNGVGDMVKNVIQLVADLTKAALDIYNKFINPIVQWLVTTLGPIFVAVGNTIGGAIGSVLRCVSGAINGIVTVFRGIIDFVVGVFTGDWKRAWEGVSNIFKGIVDGFVAIIKAPINLIIDVINGFIRGLNNIKVPDWVPGVGGKGIHIATIPKLAKGGIVGNTTIAMIGEAGKEAVLPLENNTEWMDEFAQKINTRQPIIVKIGDNTILDTVINGINDRSFITGAAVLNV